MDRNWEKRYNSEKVFLNGGWYEQLLEQIEKNNVIISELSAEKTERIEKLWSRNEKILEKLDKYKKTTEKGEVYYYFFIREIRDLFWILLENSSVLNNNKIIIDEEYETISEKNNEKQS